jgi:uncharacterized DUF497 family protein
MVYVFDGYPISKHYDGRWISSGTGKSVRNERERGLAFELAALLFDGPVIEHVDERRSYGETRLRAIGVVGDVTLHCVYT